MPKQLKAFFAGSVQGVGFRYTTERLARRFPVAGYVRNLSDGRVELVAEGDDASLQDFLKAIQESGLAPYIHNVETKWAEARDAFSTFEIRF